MLLVRGAVVDYALELASMVPRVLRSAPDTRDAELAAATLIVVVWAVNLAPRMSAADLDLPAIVGIPDQRDRSFRTNVTDHSGAT